MNSDGGNGQDKGACCRSFGSNGVPQHLSRDRLSPIPPLGKSPAEEKELDESTPRNTYGGDKGSNRDLDCPCVSFRPGNVLTLEPRVDTTIGDCCAWHNRHRTVGDIFFASAKFATLAPTAVPTTVTRGHQPRITPTIECGVLSFMVEEFSCGGGRGETL